jgi:hypothetical protein
MKHFSMLRAAFWLLAAVVLTELVMTMIGVAGCFWLIVISGQYRLGACESIGSQIREVWAEALAAILALLLAARNGNGLSKPPPPPTVKETKDEDVGSK